MPDHSHRWTRFPFSGLYFTDECFYTIGIDKTTMKEMSCQVFQLIHCRTYTNYRSSALHRRINNVQIIPGITKVDNDQINILDLTYFLRVIYPLGYVWMHARFF